MPQQLELFPDSCYQHKHPETFSEVLQDIQNDLRGIFNSTPEEFDKIMNKTEAAIKAIRACV